MKSPFVKSCGIRDIATNVLVVEEVNAPKGVTPILWILLTSLPVNTINAAWTVIEVLWPGLAFNSAILQQGIAASPLASDQWIVVKDSLEDILSNRSRGVLTRKFNVLWPNPDVKWRRDEL